MKTKELSEKAGLKERTIRFYEEQGLLTPQMERRNGRNFREYSEQDVKQLRAIAVLRRAGFSLEEIREMQEQDAAVERVFPVYLERIQKEAATALRLKETAERIQTQRMNIYELAEKLEQSAKWLDLPEMDVSPHFGRFDTETAEEKEKAIADYRARQSKKRLSPVQWALMGLSMLCVLLIVGCGAIFGYFYSVPTEPEPNGSTDGWIYYKAYENGAYYICRYQESTGVTERIYQSGETRLAVLATEEKLYVADGYDIYSLNADGSGKYLLCEDVGAARSGYMAVYDGYLYVSTALPYRNAGEIARINLDTGKLEELEIGYLTDFEILENKLYTDYAGEVTITDLDTMESTVYEIGTEPQSCYIGQGIVYELDDWSWGESEPGMVPVEVYGLNKKGQMELLYEDKLERAVGDPCFVWDNVLYYYVYVQGGSENNRLRALDFSTGETYDVTEVASEQAYPNVYFGEHGLLVAESADTPQYIPYEKLGKLSS